MKYLRCFNENLEDRQLLSDPTWEIIDNITSDTTSKKSIDFTDSEINKLNLILLQYEFKNTSEKGSNWKDNHSVLTYSCYDSFPHVSIGASSIYIHKYTDDWYYVYFNNKSYKCDQWDGLINFLKFKLSQ